MKLHTFLIWWAAAICVVTPLVTAAIRRGKRLKYDFE